MRILVVNDDGIKAPGIKRLVQMAAGLGEVWVVAPAAQCSAMSHRITVRGDLEVKPYDFPVTGVTAYSVGGNPGRLCESGTWMSDDRKTGYRIFRDQCRL